MSQDERLAEASSLKFDRHAHDEYFDEEPSRRTYIVESLGYPLTTYLRIVVDEQAHTDDRIVQIDIYADKGCKALLAEDLSIVSFPPEAQTDIRHALHEAQCGRVDREAFARKIERIQAALR